MSGPGSNHDEAARVLRAASEQIQLALQQSQPHVDALAETLRRLAALLGEAAGTSRGESMAAMRAEMLRAIVCLQYHDRMTQHLTHVREYLADSAAKLSSQPASGDEGWRGLHGRLHDRLLTETQRMYLGRNFPPESFGAAGSPQRDGLAAAKPGDIDLF